MTDLEKFIIHVKNLKSQNVKQAVFDVSYLHGIVQQLLPPSKSKPPVTRGVELDGGSFQNED